MGVLTRCDCVARSTRFRAHDASLHIVVPRLVPGAWPVGVHGVTHTRHVLRTILAAVVVAECLSDARVDTFDVGLPAHARC